ncbi:MAG: hypothetical protein ACPGQS_06040 [Bradymonadia bacterium]
MPKTPSALTVPWSSKSIDSAQVSVNTLADGRIRYAIEHDLLRGVTPAMIVWFLNHMTDRLDVGGQNVQFYRLWHPVDHVAMTYLKSAVDGRNFGSGAQVRIQEVFQANPKYAIDVKANVEFLDETGFAHHENILGLTVARMQYSFTQVDAGTLYKNALTVGAKGESLISKFINTVVRPRVFPDQKGEAWIRHNIEEVGALESFLPDLYATHADITSNSSKD